PSAELSKKPKYARFDDTDQAMNTKLPMASPARNATTNSSNSCDTVRPEVPIRLKRQQMLTATNGAANENGLPTSSPRLISASMKSQAPAPPTNAATKDSSNLLSNNNQKPPIGAKPALPARPK